MKMSYVRGEICGEAEEEDSNTNMAQVYSSTLYTHNEEKSRRNKHQRTSLRTKSCNSWKKAKDSLPVQKCVRAAQTDQIIQKNRSLDFLKHNFHDSNEKRKTKERTFLKEEIKERNITNLDSFKRESFEKRKENENKKSREKTREQRFEEFQVRGPPLLKSEMAKDTSNDFACVKGTATEMFQTDEKSSKYFEKKTKEEMNLLRAEKTEQKADLSLRSLKELKNDRFYKYEMLKFKCDGTENKQKMDLENNLDKDTSNKKQGYRTKGIDGCSGASCRHFNLLVVENEGNERRIKEVAENGVRGYCDNRLVEERLTEDEQTISKQTHDPMVQEISSSKDTNVQIQSLEENDVAPPETASMCNEARENSWCDEVDSICQSGGMESTQCMKSAGSFDLAVKKQWSHCLDCNCSSKQLKALKNQINTLSLAKPKASKTNSSESEDLVESGEGDMYGNDLEEKFIRDLNQKDKAFVPEEADPAVDETADPDHVNPVSKNVHSDGEDDTVSDINDPDHEKAKPNCEEKDDPEYADSKPDCEEKDDPDNKEANFEGKKVNSDGEVDTVSEIIVLDNEETDPNCEEAKSYCEERIADAYDEEKAGVNCGKESISGHKELASENPKDDTNTEECLDSKKSSQKMYFEPRLQGNKKMMKALECLDERVSDLNTNPQYRLEEMCPEQLMIKTSKLRIVMRRPDQAFARRRQRRQRSTACQNGSYAWKCHEAKKRLQKMTNHNRGRQCSSTGGGNSSGGSRSGENGSYSESASGSNKSSGGSGGSSSGNHDYRNHGNGDTGGGGDGRYPNGSGNKSPEDAIVPPYNPKKYRKKHLKMDATAWTEFLGILSFETKNSPVWEIENESVSWCVALCLWSPEDLSDEMMSCYVCISLNQFLKHYADCSSPYNGCPMCVQIFSLICAHVTECLNNNGAKAVCNISLCSGIIHMMDGNIANHLKTLWFYIRKKLARLIGSCEELDQSNPDGPAVWTSSRMSSLPSIPENEMGPIPPASSSSSRILSRKKSTLADVTEEDQVMPIRPNEDSLSSVTGLGNQSQVIYTRAETQAEGQEHEPQEGSGSTGSSQTVAAPPDLGLRPQTRYQSLPQGGSNIQRENYYPSFSNSPMGIKGIGEVVYGDRSLIVVVAEYWHDLKEKYRQCGFLAPHYREEGVILADCESKLKIHEIRYSCQFQWIKHNPLGNGMSGKCHLASDFNTNFKFCVKEIHISNYEKEEIVLWSELDHPNIVKVYGAIRHREIIYILQEFVEGGNLTEAINTQKMLNRRLSQVTALGYIRQLLEVLVYLKSKHILHEDLKADNILLKQDKRSVSIKVTDFGLARRCTNWVPKGIKPVGTQTQWSPEKSEGRGYGYPAEVWAMVCVFIHMLAGSPPWIRRFEHYKTLMFVIVEKSPPLEDIPRNISDDVRDMIERGLTVCQNTRPHAADLLSHRAFSVHNEAGNGKTHSIYYSNLPSISTSSSSPTLEDDPNSDLREIFRHLVKEQSKQPQMLDQSKTYTVYTLPNQEPNSGQKLPAMGPTVRNGSQADIETREQDEMFTAELGVGGATGVTGPINIDHNTIDRYLTDPTPPGPPAPLRSTMRVYDPGQDTSDDESGTIGTPTDDMIMKQILPDFEKLGLRTHDDDDDDEDYTTEEDEILKNFDFEKDIPKIVESLSMSKTTDLGTGNKSSKSTAEDISDGSIFFSEDQYNIIEDDDDLFKSGPSDENGLPWEVSQFVRVPLFKPTASTVSTDRRMLFPTLPPDTSQNPYTSTPIKGHQHSLQDVPPVHSPDSGPQQPKRLKYDFSRPNDSESQTISKSNDQGRNPISDAKLDSLRTRPIFPVVAGDEDASVGYQTDVSRSRKEEIDDFNRKRKDLITQVIEISSRNTGARSNQLHLDVSRAQRESPAPPQYSQTAPVGSPPGAQARSTYQRTKSERDQPTSQMHKSSSTTSASQFEQQEAAYRELEETRSVHSDHSHLLNLTHNDIDDEEIDPEFGIDLGNLENPPESIARYLAESPTGSIKVTFVNEALKLERKIKFAPSFQSWSWEKIIEEEFSRQADMYSNWERVCLQHSDGATVDLDSCLGNNDLIVYVVQAVDEHNWWMHQGMIMK